MGEVSGPLLFLSHAGIDSETALDLAHRLEAVPAAREAGLRVWVDKRDLTAGHGWQRQLEDAINRHSTAFAVYTGARGAVSWVEADPKPVKDLLAALLRPTDRGPVTMVEHPFVDLARFGEKTAQLFHGRGKEIGELTFDAGLGERPTALAGSGGRRSTQEELQGVRPC
jgi:hypothetical protein